MFFEKFNQIGKTLAKLTKNLWEQTQITDIRYEREFIPRWSHAPQSDNLDEMDQFLERHNLPDSTQEKINLYKPVSIK